MCLPLPICVVSREGDRQEMRVVCSILTANMGKSQCPSSLHRGRLDASHRFYVFIQVSLPNFIKEAERTWAGGTEMSRGTSGTAPHPIPGCPDCVQQRRQATEMFSREASSWSFSFIGISLTIVERKRRKDGSRESCARPACVWNTQTWLGGTDRGT